MELEFCCRLRSRYALIGQTLILIDNGKCDICKTSYRRMPNIPRGGVATGRRIPRNITQWPLRTALGTALRMGQKHRY
jgi:hypothetical protein